MIWYLVSLAFGYTALLIGRKSDEVSLKQFNKRDKWSNIFGVIVIAVFALMAGFRDNLGTDYANYVEIYENLTWSKVSLTGNIEFGYALLNMLVKSIVDYYPIVFTIAAFIMYYPIYVGCREESKYIELSWFLFVCFGFFVNSFNIMRQYMASGIMFFAFKYIYEKKFVKYLLFVIVAMMFHKVAIIMIPAYFLIVGLRGKRTDLIRISIIILAFLVIAFAEDIYGVIYKILPDGSKYQEYFNPDKLVMDDARGLTFPLFSIVVYAMYLIGKWSGVLWNDRVEKQINILILGLFFSIIGQRLEIVLRLQYLFITILIVLIPNIIDKLKEKYMLYLLVILCGLSYFVLINFNKPYESILF